MKSFPLSCRVARACAVTFPFEVATSLPGLRPPRLDMNGAECLRGGRAGGRAAVGETRMGRKDTENKRTGGNLLVYDFRGNNVLQTYMAAAWVGVGGWSVPLNAYNSNKQSLPSAVADGIATSGNVSPTKSSPGVLSTGMVCSAKCLAGSTATADGMETPESRHHKAPRWG